MQCFIVCSQHGEEVSPAASDLAMVLTRGLSMEQQKSNRDSLQYSSGYSTETTTPSCSEDTIPSQGETNLPHSLWQHLISFGAHIYYISPGHIHHLIFVTFQEKQPVKGRCFF